MAFEELTDQDREELRGLGVLRERELDVPKGAAEVMGAAAGEEPEMEELEFDTQGEVKSSGRTIFPDGSVMEAPVEDPQALGLVDEAPESERMAPPEREGLPAREGVMGPVLDFGENLYKGALTMVGQGVQGASTLESAYRNFIGENVPQIFEPGAEEEQHFEAFGTRRPEDDISYRAVNWLREATNAEEQRGGAAGMVGSVAGSLLGFGGVGLLTGPLGAGAMGVGVGAQDFYEDALREGADAEDAESAAFIGSAAGLSNILPATTLLGALQKSGGKYTQRFLTGLATNSLSEAGQEAFYEWMKNMTARDWVGYDPERSATDNLLTAAGAGGGAGAFVYSLGRLVGAKMPPPPRRTEIEEAERELRRERNLGEDDDLPPDAFTKAAPGWSADYISPTPRREQEDLPSGREPEQESQQNLEEQTAELTQSPEVRAFEQAEREATEQRERDFDLMEQEARQRGEDLGTEELATLADVQMRERARMEAERRPANPALAEAFHESIARQAAKERELTGRLRPETTRALMRARQIEDEMSMTRQVEDGQRQDAIFREPLGDPLGRVERMERENLDARSIYEPEQMSDLEWQRLETLNARARGGVDVPLLRPVRAQQTNRILAEHLSARGRGARSGRFATRAEGPPPRGMRTPDVQGIADRVVRPWRKAAPVRVVQRQRDLPDYLRRGMDDVTLKGVYDPSSRSAYLVARNLDGESDVRRTIFHEVLGHQGVHVAGPEMENNLFALYRAHKGEVDEIGARRGIDTSNPDGQIEAAEEFLSIRAEEDPQSSIVRGAKAILDRIAEALGIRLREADVRAILRANRRYLEGRQEPSGRARQRRDDVGRGGREVIENARRRRDTEEATRQIMSRREELLRSLPAEDQPIDPDLLRADQDRYNNTVNYMRTLYQLGDANPHIESLQTYIELNEQWQSSRMLWVERTNDTAKDWQNLKGDQARRLGDLLFDQTLAGRWFDPLEFARYGLDEQTRQVYVKVQNDFRDFLNAMEEASVTDLRRTATGRSEEELRSLENDMREQFQKMRSEPYFPLSRFGRYAVSVRAKRAFRYQGIDYQEGDLVWFRTYENKISRKMHGRADIPQEIRRNGTAPVHNVMTDTQQELLQFPPALRQMVEGKLEEAGHLSNAQKEKLAELAIHLAPSRSFRNKMRRRKGVPGYNEDALRSYASYFASGANHLARTAFDGPMREAIARTEREANALSRTGGYPEKRSEIARWMEQHRSYNLNPENELSGLRAFGFNWFLGFNPRSAATNLTQVPLITYPYLGARFGDTKAIRELSKAYKDVGKYLKTKRGGVTKEEAEALRRAAREGFIDESMAQVLAGIAEGDNLAKFMQASDVGRRIQQFSYASAWMFQKAEQLNRRVTLLAAHRLAKQRGADPETAYREGRMAVRRTQYEFARFNRAPLMRGKKSVLFLFYQHIQNTLDIMLGGQGKGVAARTWMMYTMAGGLLGVPFAENVMDLIDYAASKMFGKKVDSRLTARQRLAKWLPEIRETLGPEFIPEALESPDLILRGASRHSFGYFDFSGSISMGRILPTEFLRPKGPMTGYDLLRMQSDVLGAVSSIPIGIYQAVGSDEPDDFLRWKSAMPVMMQSAMEAARRAKEGEATSFGGRPIREYDLGDPMSWVLIGGRALGAEETRIRQQQEADWIAREHTEYWNARRTALMNQYDWATRQDEGREEVRKDIARYNATVPYGTMKITNDSLRQSLENRARRRAMQRAGLGASRQEIPVRRDVGEAFPELEREAQGAPDRGP